MAVLLLCASVWEISNFVKQCCARLIILYSFGFFLTLSLVAMTTKNNSSFSNNESALWLVQVLVFFLLYVHEIYFFPAHRFSVVLHSSVVRIVAENANRMLFEIFFFDCRAQCRGPFCFENRCSMDLIQSQPMCIENPFKNILSSNN